MDMELLKALQSSPKGQLQYDTGWDESPNAITTLITVVQDREIDKPNRQVVERAFKVFSQTDRRSHSPKTNERALAQVTAVRGRQSLPSCKPAKKDASTSTISPQILSSFLALKVDGSSPRVSTPRSVLSARRTIIPPSEPRIEVQEAHDESVPDGQQFDFSPYASGDHRRRLLTPPTRPIRRKKSVEGSPIFKPSPSFSSSPQTQTHSSANSDTTSATPTKNNLPQFASKGKKYGIHDEAIFENEVQIADDLTFESSCTSFSFIERTLQSDESAAAERKVEEATEARRRAFEEQEAAMETKILADSVSKTMLQRQRILAMKQEFERTDQENKLQLEQSRKSRKQQEDRMSLERNAAATAAQACREAAEEAVRKEEAIRIQQATEAEQKRKAAEQEKQRLLEEKAHEEKRRADEKAAQEARKAAEEKKQEVTQLSGLILKDDLTKYSKATELLKTYEDNTQHINGKDPATKQFYVGAVKCINTPLNALADTGQQEIIQKVEHLTKLLNGDAVHGGGSMSVMFSSKSVPNGDVFCLRTLAFRFVKKSEADVTRGTSTVQPLATVGVQLCRRFPNWASLVQAYLYKLCPFLVPFSHPQGNKNIVEYAREIGHELSGTETAVQQAFLERLKGYSTLYALMVITFQRTGPADIGPATEFFSIGGVWSILAATMKLEPQVDVTATIIHTLLEIVDDQLHLSYRNQFIKLMRFLIISYLPKIKAITPAAKAGSVSRLQIYLERKFAV